VSADRPSISNGGTGTDAEGPVGSGRKEPLHEVAPFTEWMGATVVSTAPGKVELKLEQRPDLDNRRGVLHGGVLATLLDSVMARAARSIEAGLELGGTIDLHVQFLLPARGTVTATGLLVSQSTNLAFCRGEVHDASGTLVATGTATLRLRRASGAKR
jgi:uncharacterized protein (TIGR00369 family)